MKHILVALLVALLPALSTAASYDCSQAKGFAETEICRDSVLSKYDDQLNANFRGMLQSDFGNTRESLIASQRRWLRERSKCKTISCLRSAYLKRLKETCEYGVVTGVHPPCKTADEID